MHAAANLLGRAVELFERESVEHLALLPPLGVALAGLGRFEQAGEVLDEAVVAAEARADHRLAARAIVERLQIRLLVEPEGVADEARAEAERLIPLFQTSGDEQGLASAWRLKGTVHLMECRFAELANAMQHALKHAHRAKDDREEAEALWLPAAYAFGPMPAAEGIRACEELRPLVTGKKVAEAGFAVAIAILYAMVGRADEARASIKQGRAIYRELGMNVMYLGTSMAEGWVELYSGDPRAAEAVLRDGVDALEQLGERSYLSTVAGLLALALIGQSRHDEAERWTHLSEEAGALDDIATQAGWRCARAQVLSKRGDLMHAERLAREALELADRTDATDWRAETRLALANVLRDSARPEEASSLAKEALALFSQKGMLYDAERTRTLVAELANG